MDERKGIVRKNCDTTCCSTIIVKNISEKIHVSNDHIQKGCVPSQRVRTRCPADKDLCCMKHSSLLVLIPLVAGLTACDDFSPAAKLMDKAELRWSIDQSLMTKASAEIPDTNDFILTIRDAGGGTLYEGAYGESPEYLQVDPGSYTISLVSIPFTSPAFARPQYGDEQVVVIQSAQRVNVKLQCTLLNAGIRLKIAPDFLTTFPDGVLFVKQGNTKLKYSYSEKRVAYMSPGSVSVILYNDTKDETLFTRSLERREILTVSISAPGPEEGGSSSIKVAVDTTKNWSNESFVIGGNNPETGGSGNNSGGDWESAISVADAASHIGESGVWIYGYIVGGDLTSAGQSVKTEGITKNTHIAIATRSSVTAKESCVAVELPQGKVRDALNLVDHPDLRGSRVYIKGNVVESYFGTTGLKGCNDFVLR